MTVSISKKHLTLACLSLLAGLTFAAESANAKQVGTFDIAVGASNGDMGRVVDIAAALGFGWQCHATTKIDLSESLRNHKGEWKQVTRSTDQAFNYSLFETPSIKTRLTQKLDALNAKMTVNVGETCMRTVTHENDKGETESTTETASMTWACRADMRSSSLNSTVPLNCPTQPSVFGTSASGLLLAGLKQKRIIGGVRLVHVAESYDADLCRTPGAKDVRVLNISQGVGGHMGENDFVFHLKINGYPVNLRQNDGILDSDILVCGSDDVTVQASAEEEDLIWNDQYVSEGRTLVLNKQGPGSQGAIKLTRKSYLGLTDKSHELQFQITPRFATGRSGTW